MANAPQADPGSICPLHKKDVSKVCHKCPWYVYVSGTNPQNGQLIDDWKCAIAWMPIMQVEIAQKNNQMGAAIESFRNEMVKANKMALALELEKAGNE